MSGHKLRALGLAMSIAIAACSDQVQGPSSTEREMIGSWAGELATAAGPLLLELDIGAGKDYQVRISLAGELVERERGAWALRAGRLVTTPASCEEADQVGGPLRLVACSGPDSVAVAIAGNTWPLSFTAAGELVTIELKRL